MNAPGPCPDDLLARASNAPLAPAERDRLEDHLAGCAICRTAVDVTGALADEPSALAGDDLLIARLAERAAGRAGGARPWRRRPLHVAAAVVATAAAVVGVWHFARARRPEPAPTAESVSSSGEPSAATETPQVVAPAGAPAAAEPAAPPETAPAAPESAPADRKPAHRAAPAVDIDRLLAEARAARARGDNARARTLYARVVRLGPGTPAAAVAEMAIGMMLVERADGGGAHAALEAFDRYLATAPDGALREEAMAGRARSLELLGERARAVGAWQELLAKYPRSLQAPLAQRRLDALRAAARSNEGP
jgi:tetratricopeptide (TPR) repeat protein